MTTQFPVFVRINRSFTLSFSNSNNKTKAKDNNSLFEGFFKSEDNEEISIMFVATPIDEQLEYLNEFGEWKKLEYKYSNNEFYIFVSEQTYQEVKYYIEYGKKRTRKFAITYDITFDAKTSKIKSGWSGIKDTSENSRQELFNLVMSSTKVKK